MDKEKYIEIRGARANNLKGVDVDIPRGRLTVITGISGSGKSSLAFDTIYAEGQRRYMNTLSPYAKHFMGILEKPAVESISGLSPVIAIEQKTTGSNPRSTVGTITEIYDFLRLLYARASVAYSPVTGKELVRYTDSQIVDLIMSGYHDRKCLLLAPLVRGRKGHYRELFDQLRRKGFTGVRIDGEMRDLSEVETVDRYKSHFIELVVDKLKPEDGDEKRVRSSVGVALSTGKGSLAVLDMESGTLRHFSKHLVDPDSGLSLQEPAPHSFSFNSPEGYCPHCKGLGTVVDVNIDSIIPDRSVSIADGGIVPLGRMRDGKKFEILRSMSRKHGFSLHEPIAALPDEAVSLVIYGSDEFFRVGEGALSEMVNWPGVVGDIEDKVVCPVCHGTRLNENARCFRIDGKDISEVSSMEISDLADWLAELPAHLDRRQNAIARDIVRELNDRVRFLLDVGLDYLSLDRPSATLSGGEGQRIRLATQIGSKLVNVIYILDEPSIGLHQRDNLKLIASLKKLRDGHNTVIVVEHDEETIKSADWIVDVGPGAGENGGRICYSGPPRPVVNPNVTPAVRASGNGKTLVLRGAGGNNLKNIDVSFPLGMLVGVSGVSGSGKSTLINETLMPILKGRFYNYKGKPLPYSSVEGVENIDKVIEIDQSPIGRSPRSNPATFTGVFTDIRALFEDTPDAKVRGFKAGRFSFNVAGGRCEECKGAGIRVIEMNFLPSVNVVCDQCRGRRYNEATLAVKYRGKNISEVLDMSVAEAYEFFKAHPKIAPKLKALVDVGLGYVKLGQSSVTLSGGESQRMKLAAELFRKATGNTLYMLDEPTTGLHFEDIKVLMGVLRRLVDQGNTVIVIEHNLDVLKCADYMIDMGPGGGKSGGRIIACGTPEQIASDPASVTGKYLKEVL
ncbi:MAG TPA: excinuclease ABC subunit UvrA [Candidatus Cryptobacteroides merdipullorum]|uniref:UvrABC system protein A n=1 Tax=Candidatus Cryptobacteroides merdipullorum TaxID=2840771 RepID=A0A9D1GPH7_9BACT|nr:excinuclease ABC subunit UvrA [Candidatus Cryptobacteroides merdipullorum]